MKKILFIFLLFTTYNAYSQMILDTNGVGSFLNYETTIGELFLLNNKKVELEENKKRDLKIISFPNPFVDFVYILNNTDYKIFEIIVYDINYKVVYKKSKIDSHLTSLNLRFLDRGMYILNIKSYNYTKNIKILKH